MNIYFCGSMTQSQEKMLDYKELINYLSMYGNVLNKFVGEKKGNLDNNCIYERDINNLNLADVLIADVSIPSLGVGFELGVAESKKIKTLVIYDELRNLPSGLILGNPNFLVMSYKNLDEAKENIKKFLE
ncbi:MAG: nucleoside 2-deoxyribosyltransferase [Bacilli bacterium]